MITEEMLDIYARFNGDMDGFARVGSARARALMSETQWYALDAFVLELHAVKAQLAHGLLGALFTWSENKGLADRTRCKLL